MIYISAQPDNDYFIWQLRTQIANLESLDNKLDYHILVSYKKDRPNENFVQFKKELRDTNYKICFYKDARVDWQAYLPSLRPHILAQHYSKFTIDECFYMDSDIIFRELIDFSKLDKNCYVSNTISYLGAEYIKSKSESLFKDMCHIVGIQPEVVEENEANSGGAQYVLRGVDSAFWQKIEKDCIELYFHNNGFNRAFIGHGIQSWTADMWAVLWNLWLKGLTCTVSIELDFCWPGDSLAEWERCKILHNAGVTEIDKDRYFYKGEWINRDPIGQDFSYVDKNSCSIKYIEAINKLRNGYKIAG